MMEESKAIISIYQCMSKYGKITAIWKVCDTHAEFWQIRKLSGLSEISWFAFVIMMPYHFIPCAIKISAIKLHECELLPLDTILDIIRVDQAWDGHSLDMFAWNWRCDIPQDQPSRTSLSSQLWWHSISPTSCWTEPRLLPGRKWW